MTKLVEHVTAARMLLMKKRRMVLQLGSQGVLEPGESQSIVDNVIEPSLTKLVTWAPDAAMLVDTKND